MSANQNGYWLESHTPEYDQIKYYLSACLFHQGSVAKLEIWKIENLELSYRYEQQSVNMMKLPAWVNSVELNRSNSLEKVSARGFDWSSCGGGYAFTTGVIDFDGTVEDQQECSFLFCEVAIGRAVVYDGDVAEAEVPPGYNSLYIPFQPLDRNQDGKFSLQEYQAAATFDDRDASQYRHKYFLTNSSQVLPKFIVRFKLNKGMGYTSLLSARLEPDTQLAAQVGAISGHDELMFDPISFVTIPKKEQSTADLRLSASARRNLISLDQAFSQAVEDGGVLDQVAESKYKWIDKQLTLLDDKVRTVNLNYAEVSEAIAAASEATSEKLQFMTRQKLETCLSMEIELRRQQEQVKWLDAAIAHELHVTHELLSKDDLSMAEQYQIKLGFLRSWKSHTLLRNSISRTKPAELQVLNHIYPDIKMHTGMNLYFDPFFTGGSNARGQVCPDERAFFLEGDSEGKSVQANSGGGQADHFRGASNAKYINELAQKASRFEMPAKPLESLMSVALRNLVDGEIATIQDAIVRAVDEVQEQTMKAVNGQSVMTSGLSVMSLPKSIVRPLASGDRYSAPLHSLLENLDNENTVAATGTDHDDSASISQFDDLHSLRLGIVGRDPGQHFEAAFRSIVGSAPPATSYGAAPVVPLEPMIDAQDTRSIPWSASQRQSSVGSPLRNRGFDTVSSQRSSPSSGSSIRSLPQLGGSSTRPTQDASSPSFAAISNLTPQHSQMITNPQNIRLSVQQLQQSVAPFTQFSLREMGRRKRAQLEAKQISGFETGIKSLLSASKILRQQPVAAENLYFSLPFFVNPPTCKLIYSTDTCLRSLNELYTKTMHAFKGPTLTIIRSGEFTFGAYLTHQIIPSSVWSGSPACFLFSTTLGVKLPYHAKVPPVADNTAINGTLQLRDPTAFFAQPDYLFVGNGDLSIDNTLMNGSSELENCYGIGLGLNSADAMCLLAGSPLFAIDDMEVWAVIS